MSLSYVIEYLQTIRPKGGTHIVHADAEQLTIPVFPPGQTIDFDVLPPDGGYAMIYYRTYWSPAMVPDVFTYWVQVLGYDIMSGTITAMTITHPIDLYVVVTEAEPLSSSITNASNLNQYYEIVSMYLVIDTERHYEYILDVLEHLITSAESERLAAEANKLLSVMAKGVR